MLGLELVETVRDTKSQLNDLFKGIRSDLQTHGASIEQVMDLHKSFEPLLKQLQAPESASRRVAEEIRSCRQSEIKSLKEDITHLQEELQRTR